MKKESHFNLKTLRVDGGATANKYLMQFQSDILNTDIAIPKCLQTTAIGAAYLAGLSSGFYKGLDHIKAIHTCQETFTSKMDEETRKERYQGWLKAVAATRQFK